MGFSIVGYFDNNSERRIKKLWQGMADIEVCNYLINSNNNPHIKFAIFNEIDKNNTIENINLLCKKINKIKIHFKTYSFYPNDHPFICIDIAVSLPILNLHTEIQKITIENSQNDSREYFEQVIWKPDCQLTIPFEKVKLIKAIDYLSNTELPFDGILEKIGIIEYHPVKQLFSNNLM